MNANKSMLAKTILIISMGLFSVLSAPKALAEQALNTIIEIHGAQAFAGNEIKKRYNKDFNDLSAFIQTTDGAALPQYRVKFQDLITKIYQDVYNTGDYAYINIAPIYSHKNKNIFYVIDVVNKNDSKRLNNFYSEPDKSLPDPDGLLASWEEYLNLGIEKFNGETPDYQDIKCPVSHCVFGFDEPEFKKYKDIFIIGAEKNKNKLIEILHNEKNDIKRGNAAFLLGNLKDNNEVIKILTPAIHDPNLYVRNIVMRVLAIALKNDKTANFPIKDAIAALDNPTDNDRNKALKILQSLALQPRYAKYIEEHASSQLIAQLKTLQPDVHDLAYDILKQISGQKFGDRNYTAWQNWFDAKTV
jgi:hypothetical protein